MIRLYFTNCSQQVNGKEEPKVSYVYKDGTWKKITEGIFYILNDAVFVNEEVTGVITGDSVTKTITSDNCIRFVDSSYSAQRCYLNTTKKIDLTNFTKLVFKVKSTEGHNSGWGEFGVGASNDSTVMVVKQTIGDNIGAKTITVDISNLNESYFIKISLGSNYFGARPGITLEKVWLE